MNHNATCAMICRRIINMLNNAFLHLSSGLAAALLAGSCAAQTIQPELPSSVSVKKGVAAKTYAIATANPLASQAGLEILHLRQQLSNPQNESQRNLRDDLPPDY